MSELKYRCVLFCEDIREEKFGRVSLIGVLGAKVHARSFPLMFPKFCLFIEWGEITGNHQISLTIVPPPGAELPPIEPQALIQGQPGLVVRSMILLNSFVFPKEGVYHFDIKKDGVCIGREAFSLEKMDTTNIVTN